MAMMGHASDISASYLEKSDGLFLKEYVKAEPFVTVFGVSKNGLTELTEEVQSLADWKAESEMKLNEKTEKINELYERISRMEKENQTLKEGLAELRKMVIELTNQH
jgi:hypothetical protein